MDINNQNITPQTEINSANPPKQKNNLLLPILFLIMGIIIGIYVNTSKLFSNLNLPFNLTVPTPTLLPTVTPDPTANWKVYTNTLYGLTFRYPPNWELSGGGQNQRITLGPALSGKQIYVLTIYPVNNPTMQTAGDYVKTLTANPGQPGSLSFESQLNINFAGLPAVKLNNVFAFDQGLDEIYVNSGNYIFGIFYPVKSANPNLLDPIGNYDVVQQILSTFKFSEQVVTPTTTSLYTCPPSGFVDCMPIMTTEKQKACSAEAMQWYKANCPNFRGAGL